MASCVTQREYSVAVVNDTKELIGDADVSFNGFRSGGGWIRPGLSKVNGSATHRPERATVRWRTADGVLHEVVVDVRSVLPRGYKGDISFIIQADNTVRIGHDGPNATPR